MPASGSGAALARASAIAFAICAAFEFGPHSTHASVTRTPPRAALTTSMTRPLGGMLQHCAAHVDAWMVCSPSEPMGTSSHSTCWIGTVVRRPSTLVDACTKPAPLKREPY